jgi:hypothetical protein
MDVRVTVRPDARWFVAPSRQLVSELVGLLGEENLLLRPKKPADNGGSRKFYQKPAGPRQAGMFRPPPPQQQEAYIASPAAREASPAVTRFN